MPYLTVASGDLLTAAQWNTNVRDQTIASCTSLTHPTSPVSGQYIYETDTLNTYFWNGTAWTLVPPTASPTFTGTPAAPTATAGTNTTQLATTAFANAAGGLVLITTCTATSTGSGGSYVAATASGGVVTVGTINATVTVSSAFSSTYDNYKIVASGFACSVSGNAMYIKLNNSTGSTYYGNMIYNVPATSAITGVSAANGASNGFFACTGSTTGTMTFEANIDSPFLAVTSNCIGNYSGRSYNGQFSSHDSNAASSTGFTFAPSSGTITGGTIRVYGYRNS